MKKLAPVNMTVTIDSKHRIASFAPVSGRVGLSDSTFSTITIVAEAMVTIFASFMIVCLPILGQLLRSPNCLAHKHYDK